VAAGEADALVTAGNTGAAIVAAARHFELLPRIRRAALATVVPVPVRHGKKEDPFSLVLDVGATVEADADTLVSFAHMGAAYVSLISDNHSPSVALLSNGSESHKGTPAVVEAHARLAAQQGLRFVGNVEGIDIPLGPANVVVCDGFTGNIALKMYEGMGELMLRSARYAYRNKLTWRAGMMLLRSGIQQVRRTYDWREYGGAPLLGFRQLLIKAHGRSGLRALSNAIKVAAKATRDGLADKIASSMEGSGP
jgi:glycerol-3-phosphate acyltransferase PlsX